MIEWVNGKLLEVTDLIRNGALVVGVFVVVSTYWKTKAIVPALVAALTAGIVLWTINNITWWQDRIGEETGAPAVVVDVGEVHGPDRVEIVGVGVRLRLNLDAAAVVGA